MAVWSHNRSGQIYWGRLLRLLLDVGTVHIAVSALDNALLPTQQFSGWSAKGEGSTTKPGTANRR